MERPQRSGVSGFNGGVPESGTPSLNEDENQELEVSLTTLRLWEVYERLQCALLAILTSRWEGIDDEGTRSLEAVHFQCSLTNGTTLASVD